MLVTSAAVSLFAAAAICLAVIAYRRLRAAARSRCSAPARSIMFAAVGGYVVLIDPAPERFGA